jgi:hypothetical protein
MNLTEFLDKFEECVKTDPNVKLKEGYTVTIRLECAESRHCCPICYVAGRMGFKNNGVMAHESANDLKFSARNVVIEAADFSTFLCFDRERPEARKRMLKALEGR